MGYEHNSYIPYPSWQDYPNYDYNPPPLPPPPQLYQPPSLLPETEMPLEEVVQSLATGLQRLEKQASQLAVGISRLEKTFQIPGEVKSETVETLSKEEVPPVEATTVQDAKNLEDAETEEASEKESLENSFRGHPNIPFVDNLEELSHDDESIVDLCTNKIEPTLQDLRSCLSNMPHTAFNLLKHGSVPKIDVAKKVVDKSFKFSTSMVEKSIARNDYLVLVDVIDVSDLKLNYARESSLLFFGTSFQKTARIKLTN
ncbi:OLC1v1031453C1 [Oldenlandia corymbosa var. corymbosa]|uniref:OLC1v1031453C1 n=1 Tax=Oldenlandia corymbosa var. corymbosa TaxID=529605 RepID=A0AAV1CII3_OLDCO|nr:OLC1v1031453C1 [Oldenlandia corymbosa var. corymbosa]